jgi:hypothetical protein
LFGVSPYYTRWMLWQHFANGMDIDQPADARMNWGKKLQPLVLAQCADDLKFEVHPNADDDYHRRGLLGCTRDAQIICPDRGPGALETKCVFDYRTWMTEWQGGKAPPRPHEIQLQQQMLVGDQEGEPYRWGVIAAWVAGEQHYFEREPIPELWERMAGEASDFMSTVANKDEPDPFGLPIEIPLLNRLFPTVADKVLDLTGEEGAHAMAEKVAMFQFHKTEANAHGAEAEKLRAQLLAVAKDNERVLLPERIQIKCSTSKAGVKRLTVYVPDHADAGPRRDSLNPEIMRAG